MHQTVVEVDSVGGPWAYRLKLRPAQHCFELRLQILLSNLDIISTKQLNQKLIPPRQALYSLFLQTVCPTLRVQ